MSRRSALILSPEPPYPMQGGGALRTASLLHYLLRDHDVDLILFRQAGDSDPALSLPPGMVRRTDTITLPYHSRRPAAWLLRNARRWLQGAPPLFNRFSGQHRQIQAILKERRYDLGLIEHFWCAPYVQQLAPLCKHTVLDLHNVESALHESCARSDPWPLRIAHHRFARAYVSREKQWLPEFSQLLVTSDQDARRAHSRSPHSRILVYRNALPWIDARLIQEDNAIGFSGNFEYHPNISAVRFFLRDVWPQVSSRFPGLRFRLIGKNPGAVRSYAAGVHNVEFTGPVEDAVGEIAKLKLAVVPLLAGSGTRLKILEAWAASRAVISTSIGAEGLDAREGANILIADSAPRMTESIAHLLGSTEERHRIGRASRQTFEENYTWDVAWRSLNLE